MLGTDGNLKKALRKQAIRSKVPLPNNDPKSGDFQVVIDNQEIFDESYANFILNLKSGQLQDSTACQDKSGQGSVDVGNKIGANSSCVNVETLEQIKNDVAQGTTANQVVMLAPPKLSGIGTSPDVTPVASGPTLKSYAQATMPQHAASSQTTRCEQEATLKSSTLTTSTVANQTVNFRLLDLKCLRRMMW